ncbi:MAG TPA: hypothetical protein VNO75_09775 [Gemmatimonadaceae bacterium]|nr:hypothetical protein [Gemmatimonadaceae bacterium]
MPATFPTPFLRFAALALIATACATVPQAQFASGIPQTSPFLLTAAEISRVRVYSAYDAVQMLKPSFLIERRVQSDLSRRAVYLNGSRLLGGVENLRTIDASIVRQIVFLNGMEATTRYGTGNGAGVILVSTLPGVR